MSKEEKIIAKKRKTDYVKIEFPKTSRNQMNGAEKSSMGGASLKKHALSSVQLRVSFLEV